MNPPITPINPPVTIEGPLIPGLIPKIQKKSQFQKLQFFQFTFQLNSIEERWLPER